jgi:undecaprenyl-diphosphatase
MQWFEALILGLLQGLTEFLPVSSSGHLELGAAIFGLEEENLTFSIIVHGATFLSVLVVFRNDIISLILALFRFQWNAETRFILLLLLSAVPVGVAGVVFKDQIENLFEGHIVMVGFMLLVTATLLFLTRYAPAGNKDVGVKSALIIGFAQMIAIMPGISRSGATISTALYLGIDREKATRFSFLMVLIPIFGATLLEILQLSEVAEPGAISNTSLAIGAIAAFISGLFACSWMLKIVKRGKLVYFSLYCVVIGLIAILTGLF